MGDVTGLWDDSMELDGIDYDKIARVLLQDKVFIAQLVRVIVVEVARQRDLEKAEQKERKAWAKVGERL